MLNKTFVKLAEIIKEKSELTEYAHPDDGVYSYRVKYADIKSQGVKPSQIINYLGIKADPKTKNSSIETLRHRYLVSHGFINDSYVSKRQAKNLEFMNLIEKSKKSMYGKETIYCGDIIIILDNGKKIVIDSVYGARFKQ